VTPSFQRLRPKLVPTFRPTEPPTLRKFLIVDDHAGFRRTLRAFLPAGRVVECADSRDALGCYRAEQPDWVFMVIELPGLDGLAVTRQIRERFPTARVVFVSQHTDEQFRAAARTLGARGFVQKEHLSELRPLLAALEMADSTAAENKP
jgi:DNA-binding NarL/FixJ family response regulator